MPTAQQTDSLRSLFGLGSNIANTRVAVRQKQLQDPRTSDAFRRLVEQEDTSEEMARAREPMSARYEDIARAQGEGVVANLPEVRKAEEEQRAFELEKAAVPARTAGQFAVQAAQSKAEAQNDALRAMLSGGLQPGQRVSVSGVGSVGQSNEPRPARAPASVTNKLLEAQKATQPNMIRRFFGMEAPAAATQNLSNIVQEISTAEGIHPQLIQDALAAAQANPDATVEDLMSQIEGDDLTPDERQQFLSIFSRIR